MPLKNGTNIRSRHKYHDSNGLNLNVMKIMTLDKRFRPKYREKSGKRKKCLDLNVRQVMADRKL